MRGAAGPHCPVRERRRRRAAGAVDRGGLHMRWAAACVGGGQGTLGPGFGAPVHAWAEERGGRARGAAGDRYLLKLFCDFVFHQVRVRDQGRAERLRACWLRRAARGRRPLPAEALPRLRIPPGGRGRRAAAGVGPHRGGARQAGRRAAREGARCAPRPAAPAPARRRSVGDSRAALAWPSPAWPSCCCSHAACRAPLRLGAAHPSVLGYWVRGRHAHSAALRQALLRMSHPLQKGSILITAEHAAVHMIKKCLPERFQTSKPGPAAAAWAAARGRGGGRGAPGLPNLTRPTGDADEPRRGQHAGGELRRRQALRGGRVRRAARARRAEPRAAARAPIASGGSRRAGRTCTQVPACTFSRARSPRAGRAGCAAQSPDWRAPHNWHTLRTGVAVENGLGTHAA